MKDSTNEEETRKKYIDPELMKLDWKTKYIKEEVNSVKSNFKTKDYISIGKTVEKGKDRFIDYLLLSEDFSALAIIEAKDFSKNPEKGRIQARTYSKDIENQIGEKIPIFLTNGHEWRFIDQDGRERKISGPFNQSDLQRRNQLYRNQRNLNEIKINSKIINRPRSITNLKILSEHFSNGYRSALIHMATGTGKTRVAMGLIDLLRNANYIQNVLFIVDRISLADQASSDGFKKFFSEPVWELHRKGFSKDSRFYVSTVQTLMGRGKNRLYQKFGPGFFDLIIFDEAHRSYYDKNNEIMKYFDTIKIGLTATPRETESKNTYELFGCSNDKPTVEYSYDEAILDEVLVPYVGQTIDTKILSLGIKGSALTGELKDQLRKQEENPEKLELTGSQFDRIFMDDKTNELIVREFMKLCYKSDDGKPCKSIFFCASQRHARHLKKIFGKMFPNLSNDIQVITSFEYRAEDEVKRFKLDSEPRIALSVGMLDTGVDIPEVCNIVFVKPVFSSIRFWQMVGRGTRNIAACKHREWLPNKEKNNFLILDFNLGDHSNIKYHKLNEGKERKPTQDVITRLFLQRTKLLERNLDEAQKKIIIQKVSQDIEDLDENSFIVREKLPLIKKIKSEKFDLDKYIETLEKEIAPLMIVRQAGNPNVISFISQVERLFSYILDDKKDRIEKSKINIQEKVENILQKDNISEIKQKRTDILKIMQESFWDDISFENVEFIVREIAPLMKYYEPEEKRIIQIDAPDIILSKENFVKEIEEDKRIKEFLDSNPLINKLKDGGVTSDELIDIEKRLSELKPELTIENIQKYQKTDFILFLRKMIGLTRDFDPRTMIEREFDDYIIGKSDKYNSKQLEFLTMLKKFFSNQKRINIVDLTKQPLANEHPTERFQTTELIEIINKCKKIRMK